jgi:outer membrane protein OmpA-like peptidoglycan-associated protein
MRSSLFLAIVVVALCGCASKPGGGPGVSPAPTAQQLAALASERQWLQSWFKGTPVRIEQRGDGPVDIEVPREFSFDTGHGNVKPALGAVLDKIAESLRRAPQLKLALIAAPGDAASGALDAALALRRATQVRMHLVDRGAPARQLGTPEPARGDAVELRLAPG